MLLPMLLTACCPLFPTEQVQAPPPTPVGNPVTEAPAPPPPEPEPPRPDPGTVLSSASLPLVDTAQATGLAVLASGAVAVGTMSDEDGLSIRGVDDGAATRWEQTWPFSRVVLASAPVRLADGNLAVVGAGDGMLLWIGSTGGVSVVERTLEHVSAYAAASCGEGFVATGSLSTWAYPGEPFPFDGVLLEHPTMTHEPFVARFDAAGSTKWVKGLGAEEGFSVACDEVGNAYVTIGIGSGELVRFAPTGSELWRAARWGALDIAVASDGAPWVGGTVEFGGEIPEWTGLERPAYEPCRGDDVGWVARLSASSGAVQGAWLLGRAVRGLAPLDDGVAVIHEDTTSVEPTEGDLTCSTRASVSALGPEGVRWTTEIGEGGRYAQAIAVGPDRIAAWASTDSVFLYGRDDDAVLVHLAR